MMELIIGTVVTVCLSALGGAWGIGASLNRKFDETDKKLSELEHSVALLSQKSDYDKQLLESKIFATLDAQNNSITEIKSTLNSLHTRFEQCLTCNQSQ